MRYIILTCAFFVISATVLANTWFTASGISKTEWRALSPQQRTMTKQVWANRWRTMSKEEKRMRLEEIESARKNSLGAFEKWEPVSKEGIRELKEKRLENRENIQHRKQDMFQKTESGGSMKPSWDQGHRSGGGPGGFKAGH